MKSKILISYIITLMVIFIPVTLLAQQPYSYKYSVNFICGNPEEGVLVKGLYLSAINVHNPTHKVCAFEKKIIVALPKQRPGPIAGPFKGRLGPYQAMEIDCPEIRDKLGEINYKAEFIKGYILILSNVKLTVTGIYSAAGATGMVETLHIEQVNPVKIADIQNGATGCSKCKPIPRMGEQCLTRISKNSTISDLVRRPVTMPYTCLKISTIKYKTTAICTLRSHEQCDESKYFIPELSTLNVEGFEIVRDKSTAVFTGTFVLEDPNHGPLASGDIYIMTRIGTHRRPLTLTIECEPCDPPNHSEGFLCGEFKKADKTFLLYCEIALSGWYPYPSPAARPVATFEGMLVK